MDASLWKTSKSFFKIPWAQWRELQMQVIHQTHFLWSTVQNQAACSTIIYFLALVVLPSETVNSDIYIEFRSHKALNILWHFNSRSKVFLWPIFRRMDNSLDHITKEHLTWASLIERQAAWIMHSWPCSEDPHWKLCTIDTIDHLAHFHSPLSPC